MELPGPYLECTIHSISKKPSVLALSEHWLWPYELTRQNDISDDYKATGKADSRLTETSHGGRGFGGIAILWHKTIGAIPVSDITSDHICVICFCDPNDNRSTVSVIGVYLPRSDQGMDCYRNHLQELEKIVSNSVLLGLVIILGDFNANWLSGWCPWHRYLSDIMNRHNLCTVSPCEWANGPLHMLVKIQ